MLKSVIAAAAVSLSFIGGMANAATVTVDAATNSTGGGVGLATGVVLTIGQVFTVTANVLDTWRLGAVDQNCDRVSNADGLTNCVFNPYTSGGLTAAYGTLVGQIAGGNYFVIGTNFSGTATASGELLLFNFDSNTFDNSDSIQATISVIPLPAGGLLLIGALGGLAALRRRKAD